MTPSFWHKPLNNIRKMSKRESESRKSRKRLKKFDSVRPKNKRKDVSKSSKRSLRLRQLPKKRLN